MQFADVEEFITRSREADTPERLSSLVDAITREMGFDLYALVHHVHLTPKSQQLYNSGSSGVVAVSSYPEGWIETYLERDLVLNDPVHLASHRTAVGFRWDRMSDLIDLTCAHRLIRDETLRAGIDQGFTIPANIPGEAKGSCSFATRVGRELPSANLPMAQLVGSFAFQAARQMLVRATGTRPSDCRVHLTQRQLDCLVLVARGKSDWEISRILGIAQDTVKTHMKDAREAYDVPKRVQAVLNAVSDGHISLRDIID